MRGKQHEGKSDAKINAEKKKASEQSSEAYILAETVRFELTIQVTPDASLAGRCLRPLGHVSTHTITLL